MGEMTQPAGIAPEPFHGQILDSDGHMYMPPDVLEEITRESGAGPNMEFYKQQVKGEQYRKDREINRDQLWSVKGLGALGAYDADERIEAMDMMGIKAQLLFPNTGGIEMSLVTVTRSPSFRK